MADMQGGIWRARAIRGGVAGLAALAVLLVVAIWHQEGQQPAPPPTAPVVTGPQPLGGPFSLTDHTGQLVTEADYAGRLMLVYFGFTYCPDICPMELTTMTRAVAALGPAGEQVTPILITIDPARDTADALAGYVALFSDRLVGLTGSDAEIAAVADAYGVYYARAPDSGTTEYLMDHSAQVYLMGPDGANLAVFRSGVPPERMAEVLAHHIEEAELTAPAAAGT